MAARHGREMGGEWTWPKTARTIPFMLYDEFLVAEELHSLVNYSLRTAIAVPSAVAKADQPSQ